MRTPGLRRMWPTLLCAVLLLGVAAAARAATLHPGFRTLGVWLPETGTRLDINVWYPSVRRPSTHDYGLWQLRVARNGKPHEGHYPLLLLSHDAAGTRFSHHETAAWLVSLGFVVAAPTHTRDNMDNMDDAFRLEQLTGRARELGATLDALLAHEQLRKSIDPERVGALGFGMGASGVLLLGGALLASDNWPDYCRRAGARDAYCSAWARKRLDAAVGTLPLPRSFADPRVKALGVVAPACGMLFTRDSLQYLYPPLALFRAELPPDTPGGNPSAHGSSARGRELTAGWQADSLRDILPTVPYFHQLAVDAPALAACPKALQASIDDFCGKAGGRLRQQELDRLHTEIGRFFLRVLGGAHPLPVIPPPPVLSPPRPTLVGPMPLPDRSASGKPASPPQGRRR